MRFNPPPGWPVPPVDWTPEPGWQPDPTWSAPPEGWPLWLEESAAPQASPYMMPGAPPGPFTPYGESITTVTPRTNHVLHAVLTALTCGAWGFVWIGMWLYNEHGPKSKVVTRYQ